MCNISLLVYAVQNTWRKYYGWADTLVDPENVCAIGDEGYGAPENDDWIDIKQYA